MKGKEMNTATIAAKPTLTAGLDGVWSGSASPDRGISLDDHTDRYNYPAEITTRQTPGSAYRKAAKVWDRVQSAKSMYEASRILTDAGCKLHYYCRMD